LLRAKWGRPSRAAQVPVGARFIADFCAPSIKLIIEVDGGIIRAAARRM
jgi:very-short-patch-repair endonuclease